MRGYSRHRLFADQATFLGKGHVRGCLLDLGGYPGLVDDDAAEAAAEKAHASYPQHATLGASRSRRARYNKSRARRTGSSVKGELYRLHDSELLQILDHEEGYNFERCRAGVNLADGRRSRAWIYRYRGPHRGLVIPHGDYRRAHPGRSRR